MKYQSPFNNGIIAQLPTTDWRDEQWVFGYGLYVNSLVYLYYQISGRRKNAAEVKKFINERLSLAEKPHYALYTYKVYTDRRFELLGNSLTIMAEISSEERGHKIVQWIENNCRELNIRGELKGNLPPILIPYIRPEDDDWRTRYRIIINRGSTIMGESGRLRRFLHCYID